MASAEYGKSWRNIAKITHVTEAENAYLPNCKVKRNAFLPVHDFSNEGPSLAFNDDASYCLECDSGYSRSAATGECKAGEETFSLSAYDAPSEEKDHFKFGTVPPPEVEDPFGPDHDPVRAHLRRTDEIVMR